MKKLLTIFSVFVLTIAICTTAFIWFTERADLLGLGNLEPAVSFDERDGKMTLSWKKLPYPCFYTVETYCPTTGITTSEPVERLISKQTTFQNSCTIEATAVPMTYHITAYGIFGKLDSPFTPEQHPFFKEPLKPVHISHYTQENKASVKPFLVWHAVPKAVCYEVEILSDRPENENGTELSRNHRLVSTSKIYTNGWQANLRDYADEPHLYWRVRALDLDRNPIGLFSTAEPLVIDRELPTPDKPLLNNFDKMPTERLLLYPAYNWIPMDNVLRYEVELMTAPPARENDREPSPHRIWHGTVTDSFSCYDTEPRGKTGDYYWRVRAIDEDGNTIGNYSDTAHFTVESRLKRSVAAAFGDSITHGGGAVSYSPASREYDYTTYLDFETVNLGKSGDTTDKALKRFDEDVLPFKPLNLLILTGTNDLRMSRSVADMISDFEKIKQKCRENDIRPIFLTVMPINPGKIYKAFHSETIPNWHERLTELNAYIRKQEYFIDLEPMFYEDTEKFLNPELALDGLHPDVRGKMLMAEIVNAHQNMLKK